MKRFLLVILTMSLLAFSGCSSKTEVDNSLKDKVDPIAENLLLSMKNNNHDSFVRDMDEKMKSIFTEDYFKNMNDKITPKIGTYQANSKEYWQTQKSGDYQVVYYKAKFDKESDVVIVKVVVSEKDAKTLVSGLYFDSPNLRK
jgi:hypothetical protein